MNSQSLIQKKNQMVQNFAYYISEWISKNNSNDHVQILQQFIQNGKLDPFMKKELHEEEDEDWSEFTKFTENKYFKKWTKGGNYFIKGLYYHFVVGNLKEAR